MQKAIVDRLKTGSIKHVVPYGQRPNVTPYVVVKMESGLGQMNIRIIIHVLQGTESLYEPYLFGELSNLLKGWSGEDRYGNHFIVRDSGNWLMTSALSDDNTFSLERIFYVPYRLY